MGTRKESRAAVDPRVVYQGRQYPIKIECDPSEVNGYVLAIGPYVHLLERGTMDALCEARARGQLLATLNASDLSVETSLKEVGVPLRTLKRALHSARSSEQARQQQPL